MEGAPAPLRHLAWLGVDPELAHGVAVGVQPGVIMDSVQDGTGVNMSTTRRAVLTAGLCALVSACARPEGDSRANGSPLGTNPSAPRSTTRTGVGGTPTSVATLPAAPKDGTTPMVSDPGKRVSRTEIESRYAAVTPKAWGLDVPGVITRTYGAGRALALTFDACGGPGGHRYDSALIGFLRQEQIPATLFLNARWVDANRAVFHDLATDPLFDIANHGTRHLPLSVRGRSAYGITGTRNVGEVYDEVAANAHKLFGLLGHPVRLFRSGTAHYDDVATRIVHDLGEQVIGFDVNGDGGATFTPKEVARALGAVRPGSIVICHMNSYF